MLPLERDMQTGNSEERALPVPLDSHASSTSTSFIVCPVLLPSTALPGRHGGRWGGPWDPPRQ